MKEFPGPCVCMHMSPSRGPFFASPQWQGWGCLPALQKSGPFIWAHLLPQTVLAHASDREARLLWVNAEGCFLSVGSNQVWILPCLCCRIGLVGRQAGAGFGVWSWQGGPRSEFSKRPPQPVRALQGHLPWGWLPQAALPSLISLPDDGAGNPALGHAPTEWLAGFHHT